MLKIRGSVAKRVSNPNIRSKEQPTSAPIAKISDSVEPNPIGSGNVVASVANDMIFSIPCESIAPPTINRSKSEAIDNDCCDVEVLDKMFGVFIIMSI